MPPTITPPLQAAIVTLADATAGDLDGFHDRIVQHTVSVGDPAGILLGAACLYAETQNDRSLLARLNDIHDTETALYAGTALGECAERDCSCNRWRQDVLDDACAELLALFGDLFVRDMQAVAA